MNELAWAAGFFDGEGCTTYNTSGGHRYPALVIAQVEREPLERFMAAVGMGKIYGPYRVNLRSKPQFRYHARSKNVKQVLALMWPWLSRPKRDQAIRVLTS